VESPGKLCKMKALRERLTEKVSLRNIDSMLPGSGAINVIVQSVLAQSPRQVKEIGVTNRISYHCHLNRKSPLFRDIGRVYPRGGVPGNLKSWKIRVIVKIYSTLSLVTKVTKSVSKR
jgi:hypothetical protein